MSQDAIISILKGAVIAGIGAGMAAFEHWVSGLSVGPFITPALTAFNSVVVNALRKWLFLDKPSKPKQGFR